MAGCAPCDVFRFCVDSATAVLKGEVHVANPGAPVEVTPVSMVWPERGEPSG